MVSGNELKWVGIFIYSWLGGITLKFNKYAGLITETIFAITKNVFVTQPSSAFLNL